MITRRKISPGAPGSKKYLSKYGDRLICVRYKYDPNTNTRLTTVELKEDESPVKKKAGFPANKNVLVKIKYDEHELRSQVKMFGGRWNPELKLWEIKYGTAKELNITSRIKDKKNEEGK